MLSIFSQAVIGSDLGTFSTILPIDFLKEAGKPLLYVLYTTPIADIIKSYGLHYHLYADDSQIYIFFTSQSQQDLCLVKSKLEACVKHIDSLMVLNRLKLNKDKTELLLISSKYRQSLALSYLQVGEEKICPSKSV